MLSDKQKVMAGSGVVETRNTPGNGIFVLSGAHRHCSATDTELHGGERDRYAYSRAKKKQGTKIWDSGSIFQRALHVSGS